MPKITYTAKKGLVQAGGSGFHINSILGGQSGAVNLDDSTFLTVFTAATSGGHAVLPSSADVGAIKLIIADTAADVVLKGTNATTGDLTLTNIGDMALCIYNGTEWVVGRSLG